MDKDQMLETICQWLTEAEIRESEAIGAQLQELHAFIEHAIQVIDLIGQAELVTDAPSLSGRINAEFEALRKQAIRLGLAQESLPREAQQ
jgi:hypothetical protein